MLPLESHSADRTELPNPSLSTIGRFRLLRLLGKGGMSEVFLGYDTRAGQPVALKLMSDRLAEDPLQLERFQRETVLSRRLNHPNIVRGLEAGKDQKTKRRYLVLEYIDGPSALSMIERQKRLDVNDVVHIGLSIAQALGHLHTRKFVHRDVKPDNILLSPCGEAKLIDLGLARWEDKNGPPLTAGVDGFGTSYYMPLEQALNAHFVDGRSDIFALGATLYHLLTGKVPFPGDDHREVTKAKDVGVFTPPGMINPNIPAVLEGVLSRMLARDPRQRFRNASDLIDALEECDLITGLPSYADLGQAVRDPKEKERSGEGTQPDLRMRSSNMRKSRTAEKWIIRYQDRDTEWKTRKATLDQLLTAVRAGRFRGDVFAARKAGQKLRPLVDFPEFHSYLAGEATKGDPFSPLPPPPNGICRRILTRLGLRFLF